MITISKRRKVNTIENITNKTYRYTITAKYQRLTIAKSGMPLFVSFHPNNLVKFSIEKMQKDKLTSFLTCIKSWFEGLKILKIEEEELTDA